MICVILIPNTLLFTCHIYTKAHTYFPQCSIPEEQRTEIDGKTDCEYTQNGGEEYGLRGETGLVLKLHGKQCSVYSSRHAGSYEKCVGHDTPVLKDKD